MNNDRPIVVDGYNAVLAVDKGHLIVKTGFPADGSYCEHRISRGRNSTSRIVVRAPAGVVSIAALDWCHRMNVTVAVVGSDSRLMSCMIPDSPHDGPLKRAQAVSGTTDDALPLARWLLKRKFESQWAALGEGAEKSGDAIRAGIERLANCASLYDLLSLEGYVSRLYWDALKGTALPWPDWTLKRIPEHWRGVCDRASGGRDRVRDAVDPFNALLNYGYTLLKVETRIACAGAGLDPDLGYLHVDARLRESFVHDLMEPLRVIVDRQSLLWLGRHGIRPYMFIELRDGVVRLDPDTAREYAQHLMPQLAAAAVGIAADFASQLRSVTIPYWLITERQATKKGADRASLGAPCGYCGQPLRKVGLKFCGRQCYLRHSVEVRQPINRAREKLAEMRAEGLSPGHGGQAALKRGAKIAKSNRNRALTLTIEEYRARRSAQARARRNA